MSTRWRAREAVRSSSKRVPCWMAAPSRVDQRLRRPARRAAHCASIGSPKSLTRSTCTAARPSEQNVLMAQPWPACSSASPHRRAASRAICSRLGPPGCGASALDAEVSGHQQHVGGARPRSGAGVDPRVERVAGRMTGPRAHQRLEVEAVAVGQVAQPAACRAVGGASAPRRAGGAACRRSRARAGPRPPTGRCARPRWPRRGGGRRCGGPTRGSGGCVRRGGAARTVAARSVPGSTTVLGGPASGGSSAAQSHWLLSR